ncbi:DNA-3-methyladenine glycosylase family protein [Bacillus tropicus]|uniref:DNA-3-methyladenine glycosylase family protein n=1 Tax=Bacillus tropicus TaxID=2026188 RepID=UPI0035236E70
MGKIVKITTSDEAVRELCKSDILLCKLINVIGDHSMVLQSNYFESLVKKIIGQQLSIQAANTIWNRVQTLCPDVNVKTVTNITDDDLRSTGVSKAKIIYIRDLTEKITTGELNLNSLITMNDTNVINSLTKVKGIGKWTAEMFLIFSLGRLNILSKNDVGLQRGIKWLYSIEDDELNLDYLFEKWSPYNTIVSLYLWEIVNRGFIAKFCDIEEFIKKNTHFNI